MSGRSQRHLLEIQGVDSSGQTTVPAPTAAVAFFGVIDSRVVAQGSTFSMGVAGNFSGNDTPITYTLQAGTLPTGIALNASTGALTSSDVTGTTQTGIVIRATDNSTDTADTNAFDITVLV